MSLRPSVLARLLLLLAPSVLHAQAAGTASRPSSFSVFAEGASVRLGYRPESNTGLLVGADYTLHTRLQLDPSLEARFTLAPGPDLTENSFGFGLRLERPFLRARVVPFATLLVGFGSLHFAHPTPNGDGTFYRSDNSVVPQYGGGLRFRVTPRWSIQAEVQQQRWTLGRPPEASFRPTLVGAGVTYTFPFGPETRRRR